MTHGRKNIKKHQKSIQYTWLSVLAEHLSCPISMFLMREPYLPAERKHLQHLIKKGEYKHESKCNK
jgi:hypothetical protein